MVEAGENDSFETSIIPDEDLDDVLDDPAPLSSGPSQLSSQGQLSFGGSQDSIGDFVSRAERDEQVILRHPFQPTVASTRQTPSRDTNSSYRTPDPEFHMPTVEIDGSRRSSGRSSRTIRAVDDGEMRRRATQRQVAGGTGSPATKRRPNGRRAKAYIYEEDESPAEERKSFGMTVADALPGAAANVAGWSFGVVGMSFRYAQRPLALLFAVYLFFGGLIIVQNMVTQSLFVSLSPICRLPGVSYLDLAFCPSFPDAPLTRSEGAATANQVEFDDLMGVQAEFEKVLEQSADGVSLPLEMKRSESSIRDLRTMVHYSDLATRDELVHEFDGYIDTARRTASDLQKFNVHVGSAVDSVISINRWTSRYIDSLTTASSDPDEDRTIFHEWASWIFAPFQPTTPAGEFDERALVDKYIEHTSLVSDRIAGLIVEAQAVLRLLTKAEDHLGLIHEIAARSSASVASRRDQIWWTLWGLVGSNYRRLHNLNEQLSLLRQVDAQRNTAVAQVSALIVELEHIEAGLGDLRDRVAEPEIAREGKPDVPLSVHIETIDRGVERLEAARRRIRAAENDRIREALARGGVGTEDRYLEGRQ